VTKDGNYPHGKATALLAYTLDIESQDTINRLMLIRLVDDVCETKQYCEGRNRLAQLDGSKWRHAK